MQTAHCRLARGSVRGCTYALLRPALLANLAGTAGERLRMRWFVEVSSIGDSGAPRTLCVEANQWQAALEDGRRMVGDSSEFTSFSIEVLDDGYRAVNAAFKLRYVVRRAPDDAELTEDTFGHLSSVPPGPLLLEQDRRGLTTLPAPPTESAALAAVTVPDDVVPSAPPVPSEAALGAVSKSESPGADAVQPHESPPELDEALAQTLPQSQLIRERSEEPSAENPIVYREAAYSVQHGLSRADVERALLARFQQICGELERRPAGKYIQIAIFDHQFAVHPLRPPLATLSYKDWRGAPVLAFPAFGENAPPATPSAGPPPHWEQGAPDSALPSSAPPSPPVSAEPAPPPSPPEEAPHKAPVTLPAPPREPELRAQAVTAAPAAKAVRSNVLSAKRRPGEDLIVDLFEHLHELSFMSDIAEGSDYLLGLLRTVLPSEGIVIQVFDIDSSNFVVVRAHPDKREALLHRTPDDDAFVRQLMRQGASVRYFDASAEPGLRGGVWSLLGVEPKYALCGPVRQGGRYLGLIQLVNPSGDTPFHESEANALDYICKQFADFVAQRPVVLERDTVIPPA